ncbi:MAG: phage tail sheath subtilisin-like domain-containing protein [Candidatus Zixiibacteriota bacterium]|nr:MAG: phage tail sheath subtilisin-like domain-containing protein [candidate division Zixibacteria bacterium]
MVQLSYPGVYVQEVSSGVKTIVGVSTSIAAFLGRTTRGKMNHAVRCFSYADFLRELGGAHQSSELGLSVRQFFDNGGMQCYVVRLAHGATFASTTIEDFNGQSVLDIRAKMEGSWGNGLRLEIDYNTARPGETFNLRVYLDEGGKQEQLENHTNLSMDAASNRYAPTYVTQSSTYLQVTLNSGLGDTADNTSTYNTQSFGGFCEGRRPLGTDVTEIINTLNGLINPGGSNIRAHSFDLSVDGSAYKTVSLENMSMQAGDYADVGAIATEIQSRINDALNSLVPAPTVQVSFRQLSPGPGEPLEDQYLMRITAATAASRSVYVRRSANNDISAGLMLGTDSGGVEFSRFSNFRPVPTGSIFRIVADDGTGALDRLDGIAFLKQNPNDLTEINLDGVSVPLTLDVAGAPANASWVLDGLTGSPNGNNDGVREKLKAIATAISNSATCKYSGEVHGGYCLVLKCKEEPLNQSPTVTFNAGAGLAAFSNPLYTNVRQYKLGTGSTSAAINTDVDGDDGTVPEYADYAGVESEQTGFYALDKVDLFNLMILPADAEMSDADRQQLWGPACTYCKSRRAFLLIDPPDNWTDKELPAVVQNTDWINTLRAGVTNDFSAVFYPKVAVNDNGLIRYIGPSGTIAGLMARIDSSRGVWKAAAGTEAGLRNISGLEVKLTDMQNGVLNKLGVNCLRKFPIDHVCWGARTLDGADDFGSEWKYIPIRRLALFIEESLYRGTKWVVFEPNDEPLWAKIRLNVGVFMNRLFRQGAFQGTSPSQAYFVKCDKSTTTPADQNLGIVNILVGFAPLKPAEFVVITIQQIAGDLK